MAKGYSFQPNESAVLQTSRMSVEGFVGYPSEVILTTKNLVVVWPGKKRQESVGATLADFGTTVKDVYTLGLFKDKSTIDVMPLRTLKVDHDKVQAIVNTSSMHPSLDLYFTDGTRLVFTVSADGWNEKRRIENEQKTLFEWQSAINEAITGSPIEPAPDQRTGFDKAIPGSKFLAEAVRDTVGTVSDAFGLKVGEKLKEKAIDQSGSKMVSSHCVGCGAPLHGHEGSLVRCEYCDSNNQL